MEKEESTLTPVENQTEEERAIEEDGEEGIFDTPTKAQEEILLLSEEDEENSNNKPDSIMNGIRHGEGNGEGDEDDDVVEVPDDYDEEDNSNQYQRRSRSGHDADVLLINDEDENNSNSMQNGRLEEEDEDDEVTEIEDPDPLRNFSLGAEEEEEEDDDVVEVPDDYDEEENSLDMDNNNSSQHQRRVGPGHDEDGNNSNSMQNPVNGQLEEDDDEIMEIEDPDPLRNFNIGAEQGNKVPPKKSKKNGDANTIVVNDTKSLVDLANSKQSESGGGKEPTLVIIDTNSILAGRGGVPLAKTSIPKSHKSSSIDIPDDAYLIEAPSFIVPYVFEQSGEESLKDNLKQLAVKVKEAREAKVAAGEELTAEDHISEPRRHDPSSYFDSPVGKLLSNIGMNLVQEFVQVDLLKMQKRVGEKEKQKSRMGMMTHLTQQSILSLKKNIEESKENNEPFKGRMKKCELCNFRSESELVMSTHRETPHMKNYSYRCNFCTHTTRIPQEIIFHMEAEHGVKARLERAPAYHQCPSCPFEDNSKAKLTRHLLGCAKRFMPNRNLEPPMDWDTPGKLPKLPKNRVMPQGMNPAFLGPSHQRLQHGGFNSLLPKQLAAQGLSMRGNLPPLLHNKGKPIPGLIRTNNPRGMQHSGLNPQMQRGMMMQRGGNNQMLQQNPMRGGMGRQSQNQNQSQPSISITPLPRQSSGMQKASTSAGQKAGGGGKTSFVICEICDGYIKDLDQLRNHMQWIHKVKIHPKMIYNKPPLNCQKCQFRFFTDQGLERHLLGSHGLVTSSMQDAANKGQDSGRCPLCGKVYQWKLLAHVAKDHNVTLKPAHLSYKCTVCTATFGMYKLFESHVYSAHSVTKNAPRPPERRPGMAQAGKMGLQITPRAMPQGNSYKPLKINDEITIIPQPMANPVQRNKGSLTITPQPMRRNLPLPNNEDEGIQIIEIDDASAPKNGPRSNGRFPMSETLRKRNIEISVCDSDNDDSRGPPPAKLIRQN